MCQRQQGQQHRKERCTPPRRAALAILKLHGRCTLLRIGKCGPRFARGCLTLAMGGPHRRPQ
ncbi:hypothetical protein XaplCFBP3122_00180 [Xanthomonas arboricola pv. populi]|uniref:Uncharacterized protein n=1 Tax=Xanthomonas arboricola pv. populi TaxID=487823 RepID=A0A2S6ZAE9_9XANT|nr:hypothetical protein XaplCFBP3122_00180 [Xanthomonas arboricola pv. populi]